MSRDTIIAVFCCWTLMASAATRAADVVNAADFGLNDLAPGQDATPVFRLALAHCLAKGASGLLIPPGEWHAYPDYAFEMRMAVANNDRGIKRVLFPLHSLEEFTLQAEGATLVCHDEMIPISVQDSNEVRIEGLSIDWALPFYFQARVTATDPRQNAFDLKVHDEVCYEVRGNRLVFRGRPSSSPTAWRDWAPHPTEHKSWEHNLQWNVWFDTETLCPLPGEHLWALEPDPRAESVEPGVVRLFNALPQLPQIGWTLVVKGMGSPNRTSPAIRLARSKNLELAGVTLHHAGGMGVIAQRCENIAIRKLRVALPEGKGRFVSTTADATHFNGCRGEILIEDSYFENMLDDSTNVHGCFVRIDRVQGNTLTCRLVHSQQRGLVFAEAGDRVRLVRSADLQPYADAEVTDARVLNDDVFELTLDGLPEGGVPEGSGLLNLSWQPNLIFRRCHVQNNRGRTMLIATMGEAIVEDNQFERSTLAGIQFEGDNLFWWESSPTRDVLIRNNRFRDIMGHALRVVPQIDTQRFPDALYHGGIRFESNRVESYHNRLIHAKAIDGLVVSENRFITSDYLSEPATHLPAIHIESGREVVLRDNEYNGDSPLTVKSDTASAKPSMRGNRGFVRYADQQP